MQIITNVTDIKVISWKVDVDRQCVVVDFQMIKDDGSPYERLEAIFWVTIPSEVPAGSLWYQLPGGYVTTLTQLTIDVKAGLMHLVE